MNKEDLVKRSVKPIFLVLTVVVVVTMVLPYGLGSGAGEDQDDVAGTIFGTVRITKGRYRLQEHRVRAISGRSQQQPKPEDVAKQVWERLVLLEEARDKGIVVSEDDVSQQLGEIYSRMPNAPRPYDPKYMERIANDMFHVSLQTLEGLVEDNIAMGRVLQLLSEGEFSDFSRVYDEMSRENRLVKARVATLDPKSFEHQAQPIKPEAIAQYYEKNKKEFETPEKIHVSYLLIDVAEMKKKAAEPSDEEIRKYYEANKAVEFTKPGEHKHEPGEAHREGEAPAAPQVQPLEEVRAQIVDRLKQTRSMEEARKTAERLNKDLGGKFNQAEQKFPEDAFDQLKEEYAKQGVTLVHDVTGSFDRSQVEEIEKVVGANSKLLTWGFGSAKVGEISEVVETTQGIAFFRMQKKVAPYDPGLTEPVRAKIAKKLEKEQLKKRVQLAAANVAKEIGTGGFAAALAKYPLEWRSTRYFRPPSGSTGLEDDAALTRVVSRQVTTLEPGKAAEAPGMEDKRHVVYVEDVVPVAPESPDEAFKSARTRADSQARRERERKLVDELVKQANVQDAINPNVKPEGAKPLMPKPPSSAPREGAPEGKPKPVSGTP